MVSNLCSNWLYLALFRTVIFSIAKKLGRHFKFGKECALMIDLADNQTLILHKALRDSKKTPCYSNRESS